MASSSATNLLAKFLGYEAGETRMLTSAPLGNIDKLILAATCIALYLVATLVFEFLHVPAVPGVSALLFQQQSVLAFPMTVFVLINLTLLAKLVVGGIRYDAPLFCAAVGMLALPTHGGDIRNAVLEAGSAGVYSTMVVEIVLLAIGVAVAYVVLFRRPPVVQDDLDASAPPVAVDQDPDTAGDRIAAVVVQTLVVLALLSILGQSPLKGQAIIAVVISGGLAAWITYKTRIVRGSLWYVAGTLLAGVIAYAWTYLHPEGLALGDTRGYLAGAARSLPLHYATAGVAGTIYGYWAGRTVTTA